MPIVIDTIHFTLKRDVSVLFNLHFGDISFTLIPRLVMGTEAVLTFESVDEILWCYHSNETSSAVISHGTIYLVCSSDF